MKIWQLLCIAFCIYCLNILVEERSEFTFVPVENHNVEIFNFSACTKLKSWIPFGNQTIDLDELHRYLSTTILKQSIKFGDKLNRTIRDRILNRDYYLHKDQLCLIEASADDFGEAQRYFLLPSRPLIIFKRRDFGIVAWQRTEVLFDQLIVVDNEANRESNCKNGFIKFACLNSCLKAKHRLARYFYDGTERGQIHVDYQHNRTIQADEQQCLDECPHHGCKLSVFELKERSEGNETVTYAYEARPLITSFDFIAQFLGLICLHLGICLNAVLSKLRRFINAKIPRAAKYSLQIQIAILLVCIGYSTYKYAEAAREMQRKMYYPSEERMKIYLFKPQPISLVFCVEVERILADRPYRIDSIYKFYYQNLTLLELERSTDRAFGETVKDVYLKFENKNIAVYWRYLRDKVYFTEIKGNLHRCFRVEVRPKEPVYQEILSVSKLVIQSMHSRYELFLLPSGQPFHSASFIYYRDGIVNNIVQRSTSSKKVRCAKYASKGLGCFTQKQCLERCFNRKFVSHLGSISTYSTVIDKGHFSASEWSNCLVDESHKERRENSSDLHRSFRAQCEEELPELDCNERFFTGDPKRNFADSYGLERELPLYYDLNSRIEDEVSWYRLAIDILNIQSVLFGLTVLKALLIGYRFIEVKLKLRRSKIALFLIYLSVSPALAYHTHFIISKILHEEMVHFVHYKVSTDSVKLPAIIFCFDYLQKGLVDDHHQLTTNYLNEITKQITVENAIDKIVYLDRTNRWNTWQTNQSSADLKTTVFYFNDQKCLRIELHLEYKRFQFYLLDNARYLLKVFFRTQFLNPISDIGRQRVVRLFTENEQKFHFSKIFRKGIFHRDTNVKNVHRVDQSRVELKYRDRFSSIKSPLSIFYDDEEDDQNLTRLMDEFGRSFGSYRTLSLPLEGDGNSFTIDDELFEQFVEQRRLAAESRPATKSNLQRTFITTEVEAQEMIGDSFSSIELPDFEFSLNFLSKQILMTNELNYASLILSLLNVLSLWFDFGILDLQTAIRKGGSLFVLLVCCIGSIKGRLERIIRESSTTELQVHTTV